MTRPRLAFGLLLVLGCGNAAPADRAEYPPLVFPARLPEPAPSKAAPAQAPAPPPAPAATLRREPALEPGAAPPSREHGDQPDPEPLVQRGQWAYTLMYDKGTIRVEQPQPVCLERARATARKIGRFAFELWLGRELVERVRFDFPLLATEEPPTGLRRPTRETPRFAPGAVVSTTLRVPASDRATSARILDRATGQTVLVPWPPPAGTGTNVLRDCPRPPPPAQAPAHAGSEPKPTSVGR